MAGGAVGTTDPGPPGVVDQFRAELASPALAQFDNLNYVLADRRSIAVGGAVTGRAPVSTPSWQTDVS